MKKIPPLSPHKTRRDWLSFRPYYHKSVLIVFLLGITSGLPFLLVSSTLGAHLKDLGYSNTLICGLAWLTLPYALKFIWAPIVDKYKVPLFHRYFGHRRAWLFCAQILTTFFIILLNKAILLDLFWLSLVGILLCFCAATQDIVYEAFRVESLLETEQSYGAGAAVVGFRIGMLLSGAFALYVAEYWGWQFTYYVMAACMGFGILGTLLAKEPPHLRPTYKNIAIGLTLKDFLQKRPWLIILPFIFLFKLGDTVMNTITIIFLTDLGFNKVEIAGVAKTFGIGAMIVGGVLGGVILMSLNLRKTLFLSACLQILSCIGYFIQAQVGHSLPILYFTMGLENLSCGINQTALITYMSRLCYQPSTATHYAILSSFSSFARIHISSLAGFIQHFVGWSVFHLIIALLCLPALGYIIIFRSHFSRFSFSKNPFQSPPSFANNKL